MTGRVVGDLPRRKRIRLDRPEYARLGAVCSIALGTHRRRAAFADPDLAGAMVRVLEGHAATTGVALHAYCVMPDHVHLLLSASANTDLVRFVGELKSLAQRAAWQHGADGLLWQRGFWDHFLRSDEGVEKVVRYILDNPVRAGLVAEAGQYPFSGAPALAVEPRPPPRPDPIE